MEHTYSQHIQYPIHIHSISNSQFTIHNSQQQQHTVRRDGRKGKRKKKQELSKANTCYCSVASAPFLKQLWLYRFHNVICGNSHNVHPKYGSLVHSPNIIQIGDTLRHHIFNHCQLLCFWLLGTLCSCCC